MAFTRFALMQQQEDGNRLPAVQELLRKMDAKIICLGRRNWARHAIGEVKHRAVYKACKTWTPHKGDSCVARAKQKKFDVREVVSIAKLLRKKLQVQLL